MNNIWFQSLNKSPLTPLPIVFKIAWGILYILILSSFVIYLSKGISKKDIFAIFLFILNLLLNFFWPFAFFMMHNATLAFIVVILLILTLIPVIVLFGKKSKTAAAFLTVYFLWLLFALYLNFEIIIRN